MKRKFILGMSCLVMFFIGGCITSNVTNANITSNATSDTVRRLPFSELNGSGTETPLNMYGITDEETGVEYLYVKSRTNSIALCPRYNADGTLYVRGE